MKNLKIQSIAWSIYVSLQASLWFWQLWPSNCFHPELKSGVLSPREILLVNLVDHPGGWNWAETISNHCYWLCPHHCRLSMYQFLIIGYHWLQPAVVIGCFHCLHPYHQLLTSQRRNCSNSTSDEFKAPPPPKFRAALRMDASKLMPLPDAP